MGGWDCATADRPHPPAPGGPALDRRSLRHRSLTYRYNLGLHNYWLHNHNVCNRNVLADRIGVDLGYHRRKLGAFLGARASPALCEC